MDQWVFDPQSWNLYTYVRNNPLRLIDPTGNSVQQKCDEICQESKRKAEELRKQAEAEGIDVVVIDTPAVVEVILVSEPRPPNFSERLEAGDFEFGIPVAGGLRSPQGTGGGSRLSSFFRKLFGRERAATGVGQTLQLTVGTRTTVDAASLRSVARHDLSSSRLGSVRKLSNPSAVEEGTVRVTQDGVIVSGHHRARAWAEQGKQIEVDVVATPPGYAGAGSKPILELPVN